MPPPVLSRKRKRNESPAPSSSTLEPQLGVPSDASPSDTEGEATGEHNAEIAPFQATTSALEGASGIQRAEIASLEEKLDAAVQHNIQLQRQLNAERHERLEPGSRSHNLVRALNERSQTAGNERASPEALAFELHEQLAIADHGHDEPDSERGETLTRDETTARAEVAFYKGRFDELNRQFNAEKAASQKARDDATQAKIDLAKANADARALEKSHSALQAELKKCQEAQAATFERHRDDRNALLEEHNETKANLDRLKQDQAATIEGHANHIERLVELIRRISLGRDSDEWHGIVSRVTLSTYPILTDIAPTDYRPWDLMESGSPKTPDLHSVALDVIADSRIDGVCSVSRLFGLQRALAAHAEDAIVSVLDMLTDALPNLRPATHLHTVALCQISQLLAMRWRTHEARQRRDHIHKHLGEVDSLTVSLASVIQGEMPDDGQMWKRIEDSNLGLVMYGCKEKLPGLVVLIQATHQLVWLERDQIEVDRLYRWIALRLRGERVEVPLRGEKEKIWFAISNLPRNPST